MFLERILPSFHLNTLRRCSWVKPAVSPQYIETLTLNLVVYAEATALPSTAWQGKWDIERTNVVMHVNPY